MTLGERLQRRRESRHLSQAELGRQAEVPQPLISMLERGKRRDTSTEVIRKLARVLGCTTDYLIGMHEEERLSEHEPASPAVVGA